MRRMRGRGGRGGSSGSKFGERKSFSDRGGPRGGGGFGRGSSRPGDMKSRYGDSRSSSGGGYRGSDRSGGRRGGGGGSGSYGGGSSLKGKQPGGNLRKPTWDMSQLQPFAKDFYKPHPRVQNRYVLKYDSGELKFGRIVL